MRKIDVVAVATMVMALAGPAAAQGRGHARVEHRRAESSYGRGDYGYGRSDYGYGRSGYGAKVPPGQLPPQGMCRVWIDGVPPGRQPAPTDCATAYATRPPNARVIYGSGASAFPGKGKGKWKQQRGSDDRVYNDGRSYPWPTTQSRTGHERHDDGDDDDRGDERERGRHDRHDGRSAGGATRYPTPQQRPSGGWHRVNP